MSMPTCYIEGGTLPAQDAVTFSGDTTFRPQSNAFTNLGVININSTDRGLYGAAPFFNQGTVNIEAADQPTAYSDLTNAGEFITAVDFYNGRTFTNTCTGIITGNIIGAPVIEECPPAPPVTQAVPTLSTWSIGLLAILLGFVGIRHRRK